MEASITCAKFATIEMQTLDFNRENIKTDEITDPICGMEYNQTIILIEKLIGLMLTIGWKIPKEYLC